MSNLIWACATVMHKDEVPLLVVQSCEDELNMLDYDRLNSRIVMLNL